MKKLYITFSGAGYDYGTQRIVEDGPKMGADEVYVYDDEWLINTEFYQLNKWLWDIPDFTRGGMRGFGWYCWKPMIILDALSTCQAGDVVLYTDADCFPVSDFSKIFEIAARDGAMLFSAAAHMNKPWCKRDCYITMGLDEQVYHDSKAGCARFMAFKRGPWTPQQFLMEWLTYCVNPLTNTFNHSIIASEDAGFIEHRCEQAIMTLLAHKYNYKLWRECDESGEGFTHDREVYGQLFQQRNLGIREFSKLGSKYRRIP